MITNYKQTHADRIEEEADALYHRLTEELQADANWQRCTARQIHFEVKRRMDSIEGARDE